MSERLSNSEPEAAIDLDAAGEWMRKYMTQRRVCDSENGVLRNIVKQAKADGIDTEEMIATCKASKMDPVVALQKLRARIAYHAVKNIVREPDELLDGVGLEVRETTRQAESLFEAEEAGFRAGRGGMKIDDNPYAHIPGSEAFVRWREWWGKGQAAIARELGPNTRQASATRKRPARGARQASMPGMEPVRKKQAATRKKAAPLRKRRAS